MEIWSEKVVEKWMLNDVRSGRKSLSMLLLLGFNLSLKVIPSMLLLPWI